jgi:hypothetical protein
MSPWNWWNGSQRWCLPRGPMSPGTLACLRLPQPSGPKSFPKAQTQARQHIRVVNQELKLRKRRQKSQDEARLPAEKLLMGPIDDKGVRVGCSGLPPPWRADEDALRDKSAVCNPEDPSLLRSPHESPAHCACHAGWRRVFSVVAGQPIYPAIGRCAKKLHSKTPAR